MVRPALRVSSIAALSLAVASLVGCAPAEEDVGTSGASALVSRSCGVTPTDNIVARNLSGQLQGQVARSMTAERVACARVITQTARDRGLGDYAARIAVAAAIVEANLDNVTVPDQGDGVGLFQQSAARGWGTPDQLTDPVYATNAFFDAMVHIYGEGWRYIPVGAVAPAVQRHALAGPYEDQAADAERIVAFATGVSCPNHPGAVGGAIAGKYLALGGCGSVLGAPVSFELDTADHRGRYSVFENGGIYWRPDIGAHEVHGGIRDAWKGLGWEVGALGYPIGDEEGTPDGVGRYEVFENGSIYWSPATGAHDVRGAIRAKWGEVGWEGGALGYPTSGEIATPEGARGEFEHGVITWTRATGDVTVTMNPPPAPEPPPGLPPFNPFDIFHL
jgi:hypothetical protein